MSRTREDDLVAALAMVDHASRLALDQFRRGVAVTSKPDGSPVSEADREVERLLRQEIRERWPDDAILGEELGGALGSERTWIIDPIDGTSSFVKQDPSWRVHLALEIRGQIAVAVVAAPALGLWWWARRGGGAFESRWPRTEPSGLLELSVSSTQEPSLARLQGYPLEEVRRRLVGWDVSALTSVVPDEVMRGQLDAVVFRGCHAWDHAPWILLVQEAGGCFTDWDGGSSAHTGGGVFSNAELHSALVLALGMGAP